MQSGQRCRGDGSCGQRGSQNREERGEQFRQVDLHNVCKPNCQNVRRQMKENLIPGVECTRRFSSTNPAMSSASLDLRPVNRVWLAGEILSPRFVPNPGESLRGTISEEDAQREF